MANENQLKLKTVVIATSKEREYQETIEECVTHKDSVLEIGMRNGETSALIASKSKEIIGTHHVQSIVDRAKKEYDHIHFEIMDGFDALSALHLGDSFDVIYLNSSQIFGYDSLLDMICLLNMYMTVIRPRIIVVRSKAIKSFVGRCFAWDPSPEGIEQAKQSQSRWGTKFVGTRGVDEFRASIPVWVNSEDDVLEIGCEWGTTTTLIEPVAKSVFGTDISEKCINQARELYPRIEFGVLDGFDVLAALKLQKKFSKIYIDISGLSGYRSLLDVISLLTAYETMLNPEAIIIKSGSLKRFAEKFTTWNAYRNPEE